MAGVHQRVHDAQGRVGDGDRKRGYLVERAWREAAIPGSRLILKPTPGGARTREPRSDDVWRIERDMTAAEIIAVDRSVDLFVWPTRGEGFGLTPLEKLSRSIPVAVTGWSGSLDYLGDFESSQIDEFELTDVIYNGVATMMADVPLETLVRRLHWAHENLAALRARRAELAALARSRWDFRVAMVEPLLECVAALLA